MRRTPLVLAALLIGTTARADMLPDGYKGVKLSIEVEATVPAGKRLVLANTFEGADVLTPGAPAQVGWHPLGGAMQLELVDASKLTKLEEARENLDREAIKPMLAGAVKCGEPFQGVRTIPESSPASEVRWRYKVEVDGARCDATLVRTEYLDEAGKVVDPDFEAQPLPRPPTSAPLADPPDAADDDAKAPDEPAEGPKPPTPGPAPKGKDGCRIGDADASGAALVLVALAALRRRRRA